MLLNGRLDNPVIAVGSYSICMVLLGISTAIRPLMHLSTVIMLGQTDFLKRFLVSQGCIKRLCDLPIYPDPRILTVCLEGLENILKVGEADKSVGKTKDISLYAQMIEDAEGLEKMKGLQNHDNSEIYEKVVKILETY